MLKIKKAAKKPKSPALADLKKVINFSTLCSDAGVIRSNLQHALDGKRNLTQEQLESLIASLKKMHQRIGQTIDAMEGN